MYTISDDKFLTPKHIGLASTLHQATRSKELVKMFHKAGHTMTGPLTAAVAKSAEEFVCKIYGVSHVDTCDKARVKLFCEGRSQESLSPTSDAVKFHMRSHYQATTWNQAHLPYPSIPPLTGMGCILEDGQLKPQLLSLPPIPKACREITSCSCIKGCLSKCCSCIKYHMQCVWRHVPAKNLTIITTTAATHLMKMSNIVACSAHTCRYFNENRGISFTGVLFWYAKCCFLL